VTARFRADATVIHVVAVMLTFLGAHLAGDDAGVQLRVQKFIRRFGLPREQTARRVTDIGAVQVVADTAAQVLEVLAFPEARVGAGSAGICAGRQRAQRLGVKFDLLRIGMGMMAQHQFNRLHATTLVLLPGDRYGNVPGSLAGENRRITPWRILALRRGNGQACVDLP
jgi:hypothetical protein